MHKAGRICLTAQIMPRWPCCVLNQPHWHLALQFSDKYQQKDIPAYTISALAAAPLRPALACPVLCCNSSTYLIGCGAKLRTECCTIGPLHTLPLAHASYPQKRAGAGKAAPNVAATFNRLRCPSAAVLHCVRHHNVGSLPLAAALCQPCDLTLLTSGRSAAL